MTSRPAAHIVRRFPAPAGEHPNKYLPWITVDFRVFWTPLTIPADIDNAVAKGIFELNREIGAKYGERPGDT